MSLIRRSDWPLLASPSWITDFFDAERFFDSDWLRRTQMLPAVNVNEKEKEFEIEMAAPGMKKSDFKISHENHTLTISSEKEEKREEKDKDYMRREFNYTSFTRSFNLPENAMEDKIAAHYEDGILKVSIPKKVPSKETISKPIEVR
ncbi:MAG: Hsp20/alpha crystallin family protein [Bacteroidetes bacterium]|nr:Hsp20/alpha crystallin family protein [Bacteroidota bacterium]